MVRSVELTELNMVHADSTEPMMYTANGSIAIWLTADGKAFLDKVIALKNVRELTKDNPIN